MEITAVFHGRAAGAADAPWRAAFFAAAICASSFSGCENASEVTSAEWRVPASQVTAAPAAPYDGGGADSGVSTGAGAADSVAFSALRWDFGGANGSEARQSGVRISRPSFGADELKFWYDADLSAWGMQHADYSGALACMFVQRSDGAWVGGKMDWISSSRTARDYHNVFGGYNGWTLAGVPNPCAAAFVIISADGERRSNVVSGTWRR